MFGLTFDKKGKILFFILLGFHVFAFIADQFVDNLFYSIVSAVLEILALASAVFLFGSFYDHNKPFAKEEIKNISYSVVFLNFFIALVGIFISFGIFGRFGFLALIIPVAIFFVVVIFSFVNFFLLYFCFFLYNRFIVSHIHKRIIGITFFSVIFIAFLFMTIIFAQINTLSDEKGALDCNSACMLRGSPEGICGGGSGEVIGSKYCVLNEQCVCVSPRCNSNSDCRRYNSHFQCVNNECVYATCNDACQIYYGFSSGVCGGADGEAVGSVYCGQDYEQCRCIGKLSKIDLRNSSEKGCVDSDGGKNLFVKGTTFGLNRFTNRTMNAQDSCSSNYQVVEYYCDGAFSKTDNRDGTFCPNKSHCIEGACVNS